MQSYLIIDNSVCRRVIEQPMMVDVTYSEPDFHAVGHLGYAYEICSHAV